METQGFTTRILHSPYLRKDAHNALQMPIYSNASFDFENAEQMEEAFNGRNNNHMYSRISNPTVENFEQRIRSVTCAKSVTALSSGMAAIANVFFTLLEAGDNIITSKFLFGNTVSFFASTIKAFGVETRTCNLKDRIDIERNIDSKTRVIFFETITNPQLEVVDISILSEIAKRNNILLISDSTITPPNIFDARSFGINIEVISSTKIISGGANSIGGLIIDYGNFPWLTIPKLHPYAKKFGPFAFNAKLRKEVFRNLGACLSPYHAYLQGLGLETMALRYEKSATNALHLAEYLERHPGIENVNFPGLAGSPYYDVSKRQFGKLPCALLTFNLSSKEQCFHFLNQLKIMRRTTNLYDNKTLIMHPASTIFCDFSKEQREDFQVSDTLIRLSVGIENVEDLIEDIDQSLKN